MAFIQIQFRKGTASEWSAANPTLARAEIGVETDTGLFKIGDGSTTWNSLPYSSTYWSSLIGTPAGLVSSSTQAADWAVASATSASHAETADLAYSVEWTNIANLPADIVSSSTQVISFLPIGTVSSSTQVNYPDLQNIPTNIISSSTQVNVLDTLNVSTLATTASNTFNGNQIVSGSVTVLNNLIVFGSSSISYISQSTLNVGTNLITVNSNTPSVRFAGLAAIDSGSSPLVSGSLLFDAVNNNWIFVHANTTPTSSLLLMAAPTYNNIGGEINPTTNRILKSVGKEHVGDSNITDTGTLVTINSNTDISGSLTVNGLLSASLVLPPGTVSSSAQIFPYVGNAEITGSVIIIGELTSIQNTFGKLNVRNETTVSGSLSTTNAAVWVGSDSSHEVALIIAGSPTFKVDTTSNFVPVTDALQDIGGSLQRIRTVWAANISSSTPIDSASYAVTASYALNSTAGGSGETFNPFLLAGM